MKTSVKGINLIKKWETFVPNQYICAGGMTTIGYGHVIKNNEEFNTPISEEEANILLQKDIERFEKAIDNLNLSLTQNQFDACISLSFNIGTAAFNGSTLVRKLREGDIKGASQEFIRWNRSKGKILKGLSNRRVEEQELFLEQ